MTALDQVLAEIADLLEQVGLPAPGTAPAATDGDPLETLFDAAPLEFWQIEPPGHRNSDHELFTTFPATAVDK